MNHLTDIWRHIAWTLLMHFDELAWLGSLYFRLKKINFTFSIWSFILIWLVMRLYKFKINFTFSTWRFILIWLVISLYKLKLILHSVLGDLLLCRPRLSLYCNYLKINSPLNKFWGLSYSVFFIQHGNFAYLAFSHDSMKSSM